MCLLQLSSRNPAKDGAALPGFLPGCPGDHPSGLYLLWLSQIHCLQATQVFPSGLLSPNLTTARTRVTGREV